MIEFEGEVTLHEESGVRILVRPDASEQFVHCIEETEFGSEGLRYRRLGVPEQTSRLEKPAFVELHSRGELVGTYTLSARRVQLGDRTAVGLYRSLLTLKLAARGQGLGRRLVEATLEWIGNEACRNDDAVVSWGCIESSNSRSRNLLESLGAQRIGSLDSLLVYRQWPRSRIDIENLAGDRKRIAEALAAADGDTGLRGDAGTFGEYLAVIRGGEIVAGARVTITRIDLSSAVGAYGVFHERVGRLIPAVRRRFDPSNFTYLRLSDVVAHPESAAVWRDLLPTLMRKYRIHMAMFVLDPRSTTYRTLDDVGLFGRFAHKTRTKLDVLATSWNTPDDTIELISRRPLGIGPLDV